MVIDSSCMSNVHVLSKRTCPDHGVDVWIHGHSARAVAGRVRGGRGTRSPAAVHSLTFTNVTSPHTQTWIVLVLWLLCIQRSGWFVRRLVHRIGAPFHVCLHQTCWKLFLFNFPVVVLQSPSDLRLSASRADSTYDTAAEAASLVLRGE